MMYRDLEIKHNFILGQTKISEEALKAILYLLDVDKETNNKKQFKIDIQAWLDDNEHDEAWVNNMMKKIYK